MKVNISHVEKKQGLVFKKHLHGVELAVQFSDEEKAIISERKLGRTILMERGAPADTDPDKMENRGLAKKIAMSAIKGDMDANNFHMTFNKLIKGADTFWFETPIEAKDYSKHNSSIVGFISSIPRSSMELISVTKSATG